MNQHLISRLALTLALGLGLAPMAPAEVQAPAPQASSPLGQGQQQGQNPARMAQRAERMAKHLNLTEDQRARIKAIHEKHKGEMKGQREATQQARKTFFEAAKNPETPVDQLRKLHQTMSDKAFDMLAARRAVRLETRQVLTPEQREKAAEAQGRMGERMKQRRMGARDMRADH